MSTARGPRDRRASARRPPRHPGTGRRPGGTNRTGRSTAPSTGRGLRTPVHVRRLITLAALLVVMALVVAPALSGYLSQRADIEAARQQIVQEQQEIQALEEELAKWQDKEYVEQQARERLRYVKEGETAFTVIDDTGTDYTEALPGMAPISEELLEDSPWYSQVWSSVIVANEGLPEPAQP